MTTQGICRLCRKPSILQKSHAIGDAVFKKIFRSLSGKGIEISTGNNEIVYSKDSWAEYLLCKECETLLNTKYETYALSVLRGGKTSKITKSEYGVTISNIDQHKLIIYFLSIYWRAAHSTHPAYKKTKITQYNDQLLRNTIRNDVRIPAGAFTIKINKVIDLTDEKGFTPDSLKQVIVSPFPRSNFDTNTPQSFCFMFEGFFIEIFTSGIKIKKRNQPGILSKNSRQLFIPNLDLFKINEVIELMTEGYRMHATGNSKVL